MLSNTFSLSRNLEVFQVGLTVVFESIGQAQKANLIWGGWSQSPSYVLRCRDEAERSIKAPPNHPTHQQWRVPSAQQKCHSSIDLKGEKYQLWNILNLKGFELTAPVPQESNCSHWMDAVGDIRLHSDMPH